MAVAFKQTNYDVEIMRDDEVIVITIPASQLFDPNDTVLNKLGEEQLKPFLRMLNNPGFYKLLLVMHSDNTGSSEYTLNLTRQRVNAIFDWFEENGSVDYVVPYALGRRFCRGISQRQLHGHLLPERAHGPPATQAQAI